MFRATELQALKQRELAKMATKAGVHHAHYMKKAELIELLTSLPQEEDQQVKKENNREHVNVKIDMEKKFPYIESAEEGTLVAFRLHNGRVKSAKIVGRCSERQQLKVETAYGAQYTVAYQDVLWVRTGKRWPFGVYQALKEGQVVSIDE